MKKKLIIVIPLIVICIVGIVLTIKSNNQKGHDDYTTAGDTNTLINASIVGYNTNNNIDNNVQTAIDEIYSSVKGVCYLGYTMTDASLETYTCTKKPFSIDNYNYWGGNIIYNNGSSGLVASNVQDALDEITSHLSYCESGYTKQNVTDNSYDCYLEANLMSYTDGAIETVMKPYSGDEGETVRIYTLGYGDDILGFYVDSRFVECKDLRLGNYNTPDNKECVQNVISRFEMSPYKSGYMDSSVSCTFSGLSRGIYYITVTKINSDIELRPAIITVPSIDGSEKKYHVKSTFVNNDATPTPTPTPIATAPPTPTPTAPPTPTPAAPPTPTPAATPTPTPTATPTPTPAATNTPIPFVTNTPIPGTTDIPIPPYPPGY